MKTGDDRKRLLIGEAANLLGMTPKAIRHYEKVGLLGEPLRSEAGYRLYSADDLWRLHRIKKLRSLGLSLDRIRGILGEERSGSELRPVLEALLGEVEIQLEALEERRSRLRKALVKEDPERDEESPYPMRLAEEYFGEDFGKTTPKHIEEAEKLWAGLDSFAWPSGYRETLDLVFRHYAGMSEEDREEAYALEGRFAALASEPEDSPEIERLARDQINYDERHPLPEGITESGMRGAMGEIFAEVFKANLSPAQRRWIELIEKRYEERKKESEE